MNLTVVAIAAGALLLTLLIIPPLRDLSIRKSWLDHPGGRKKHSQPMPFVGGWAIFIVFWLAMGAAFLLIRDFRIELGRYAIPFFLAHLLIFAGGIFDDFSAIRPRFKLVIQTGAALILWVGGLQIGTIYVPFVGSFLLAWPLSLLTTVFWVLLIVNSMNFVDGMNGLAGGLAVLTAAGLLYTSFALDIFAVKILSVIVMAIALGFLRYNFPEASTFMGDSGSQSLGFIFAVVAIYCPIKSYTVVAMFVPLLTLGVPLIELVLTFFRRLLTGKPLFRGDYRQSFHVLHLRGLSKFKTVIMFWGFAAALQVFAFTLFLFDRRIVFSILVLFMLIVAGWFLLLSRKEER